jgi:hypothetical protein
LNPRPLDPQARTRCPGRSGGVWQGAAHLRKLRLQSSVVRARLRALAPPAGSLALRAASVRTHATLWWSPPAAVAPSACSGSMAAGGDHPRLSHVLTVRGAAPVIPAPQRPRRRHSSATTSLRGYVGRPLTSGGADDPLNAALVSTRVYPLLTVQSGRDRARFLRLHIIGPRGQSTAFRAWESAAGIGQIRTVGWPGVNGQSQVSSLGILPRHRPGI